MRSKLIKLEREISLITNQIQNKMSHRRINANRLKQLNLSGLRRQIAETTRQKFTATVAVSRTHWKQFIVALQNSTALVIRRFSFLAKESRRQPASRSPTPRRPLPYRARTATRQPKIGLQVPLWISLGLMIVCGIVILALIGQIRTLKSDMAQISDEFAVTKLKVDQLERFNRQIAESQLKPAPQDSAVIMTSPSKPFLLNDKDKQIIRQFIRVAPPPVGASAKIRVGEASSGLQTLPIPASLADALPQLRGAKFSIDQNGAIILIAAGSERVDAVIAYR